VAEFPALPLWTDAYLGDTTHLTTIEHGAYMLLLMAAWRSPGASLPDDDAKLARYARMTRGQWARVSSTIREFFRAENGVLVQSRLTDEAKHVRQVRQKQRDAGRASALKRKGRHSTDVEQTLNERSTPTPTPTPTPIVEETNVSSTKRAKRAAPAALPKPDDVSDQVWADFNRLRAKQGAPPTATALAGIRREAGVAAWTMEQALTEVCERNWRSFKADWVKGNGRNGQRQQSRSGHGVTIDAALDFVEGR